MEDWNAGQRSHAVQRMRSLLDMHGIPFGFGDPGQLEGLLGSIRQNRHFAMDFWALVNLLSDAGTGTLTDGEMHSAVVEAATGMAPEALPESERGASHRLGLLLSGVDIDSPLEPLAPPAASSEQQIAEKQFIAEPPPPLSEPSLAPSEPSLGSSEQPPAASEHIAPVAAPVRLSSQETIAAAFAAQRAEQSREEQPREEQPREDQSFDRRRALGDALSRLEQRTQELREELSRLDTQLNAAAPLAASLPLLETPMQSHQEPVITEPIPAEAEASAAAFEVVAPVAVQGEPPTVEEHKVEEPIVAAQSETAPVEPAQSIAAAAETEPITTEDVPVAPVPEPARSAAVAEADERLPHRGSAPVAESDLPPMRAPFSSFSSYAEDEEESAGAGRWITAAVVVIALSAGAWAGARTETGHELLQRAVESVRRVYGSIAILHAASSENASAPAPTAPAAETAPAAAPGSALPPMPQTSQTAATPPESATSAPQPVTAAGAASTTAQPPAATPGNTATQASAAAHAATAAPQAATAAPQVARLEPVPRVVAAEAPSPGLPAGILSVPPSAMTANLIASRVPVYPEAARELEVEGPVTLEVLVSETGAVRQARVLDGDKRLRTAAQEAVMRWRYKPYLLNGVAVPVTTTVRVEFRLPAQD